MYGSMIRQQIARTNRNLLVSNVLLLALLLIYAIVMTVVTGQNQFFITMKSPPGDPSALKPAVPADMSHPTEITVKDLDSEARLRQLVGHAIRLTDKQSVDIVFPVWNAAERGGSKNPSLRPNYRITKRGERFFLVLPPDSTVWPVFTGVLRPLEQQDASQVTTVLHSRGIQNFTLMPYMLDGLSHPGPFAPNLPHLPPLSFPIPNTLLLLLGAVPVWNVVKALQRGSRPETHPLVRRLEKYGRIQDIAKAIDAEVAAGVTKIAPVQFTTTWMIVSTFFSCIVLPLDEIVWIYERVYVTRGRSYAICLRNRQGGYDEFTVGMFQVAKIIQYVSQVRPWVMTGYSGQMASDFASNRAQFIAEVDKRRQQYWASAAPQSPYASYPP